MKYLSIDLEATGLDPDCLLIEYAMIPFCSHTRSMEEDLSRRYLIKCPPFSELESKLNPWVIEHNKELIENAHQHGISMAEFKRKLTEYFESKEIKEYFGNEQIVLFGKSMSAIDLPFLTRDLGNDFMRKFFKHRHLDLSSLSYGLIDMHMLDPGMESGEKLSESLKMGAIDHTALGDAKRMVNIYFELLKQFSR